MLDESEAQVQLADKALSSLPEEDVKMIKSDYACQILLNRSAVKFHLIFVLILVHMC